MDGWTDPLVEMQGRILKTSQTVKNCLVGPKSILYIFEAAVSAIDGQDWAREGAGGEAIRRWGE